MDPTNLTPNVLPVFELPRNIVKRSDELKKNTNAFSDVVTAQFERCLNDEIKRTGGNRAVLQNMEKTYKILDEMQKISICEANSKLACACFNTFEPIFENRLEELATYKLKSNFEQHLLHEMLEGRTTYRPSSFNFTNIFYAGINVMKGQLYGVAHRIAEIKTALDARQVVIDQQKLSEKKTDLKSVDFSEGPGLYDSHIRPCCTIALTA